jgi:hypothetical protein
MIPLFAATLMLVKPAAPRRRPERRRKALA